MKDDNLKRIVDIYADGACSPNPGTGGFGIVIISGDKRVEISQGYKHTTNNRMELLGVIMGLEALKNTRKVNVHSDSTYVVNGMKKGWAKKWEKNGWKKSKNELAKNIDLWKELLKLSEVHDIQFHWVRGHSGNVENERCDELANEAINSDDLKIDTGYKPETSNKGEVRSDKPQHQTKKKLPPVRKESDPCRGCGTPVVKKARSRKKLKPNQEYFFKYYFICPDCSKRFNAEEAKVFL